MIRVLVVDDSPLMIRLLSEIIHRDPELSVVGTAAHGLEAVQQTQKLHPDVITMDVNMPRMDGLKAVELIMSTVPTPIIMISSLTQQGAEIGITALELGAIDVISKPSGYVSLDIADLTSEIISKIRLAAKIRVVRTVPKNVPMQPLLTLPDQRRKHRKTGDDADFETVLRYVLSRISGNIHTYKKIVVIGCSTGGPQALTEILRKFPMDFAAPILVAQHMPEKFTEKLAESLNNRISLHVVEAQAGMSIRKGVVYIAPGAYHMKVWSDRTISLIERAPTPGMPRPSVDLLMQSVAQVYGNQAIGVILTGMGNDGVAGMLAIKNVQGATIAQDEETSLVFGMPKTAIEAGCVDAIMPLALIADEIIALVQRDADGLVTTKKSST